MLSSMEGNLHDLNERPFIPFVLDAESGFVLSTSPIYHLSPSEFRPGPLEEMPYPIHITT
jgi:hypothetical protein